MILLKNTPPVEKLVDFVIQFSDQNNFIIMSQLKKNGLYTPLLLSHIPEANMSVHSSHIANMQELVYYFYLVFNCPHMEAYCKIVDSREIVGLSPALTTTAVRKNYPHQDIIRTQAQLSIQTSSSYSSWKTLSSIILWRTGSVEYSHGQYSYLTYASCQWGISSRHLWSLMYTHHTLVVFL